MVQEPDVCRRTRIMEPPRYRADDTSGMSFCSQSTDSRLAKEVNPVASTTRSVASMSTLISSGFHVDFAIMATSVQGART